MKKLYTLLALILAFSAMAQVPQGISYQAIALNGSGNPVVNSNVGLRLSVLDNSTSGTVLYVETHVKTTNAQGLFNTVIGQGTAVTGTFSFINWGANSKFLKVEMDAAGGTNYILTGSTQLLSVPYAMYAGNTASVSGSSINDDIEENKNSNFAFYNSFSSTVYAFSTITGTWIPQQGSGGASLVGSNGNFAFYDSFANKVYAFNKVTGIWLGQTGAAGTSLNTSAGNFAFYDSFNSIVYAYSQNTGNWVPRPGSGGASLIASNGNFAFYDSFNSIVYAFNTRTGTWIGQPGNAGTSLIEANGSFAFYDSFNAIVYVFNKANGTWSGQSGSGGASLISSGY